MNEARKSVCALDHIRWPPISVKLTSELAKRKVLSNRVRLTPFSAPLEFPRSPGQTSQSSSARELNVA